VLRTLNYETDKDVRPARARSDTRETIYVIRTLAGAPVGLTQVETSWTVSYKLISLGTIDHQKSTVEAAQENACGLADQRYALSVA
jgi:hypothetical protein